MEPNTAGARADVRAELEAALAGTYAFERELGGGGMSRVFVARDLRLGRPVVVKVLHPDLAAGLSARRFEREVTLAARLQHPHVVPVHAAGEVGGLPYYVMPFVEGESLRERVRRDGALPVADVVRLVREVAGALAYAHAEGVVHRDLKPENVLLSQGHALIADFGVAKALASAVRSGAAAAGDEANATALGLAVGTPAYMAPEQVAADPAVDHRADLYALGVIAYELLAGAHPFAGRTPQAMLAAHLTEAPPPLAARRADVPAPLDALVARLLAKAPEDRPPHAADVVRALDAQASGAEHAAAPRATTAAAPPPRRARRTAIAAGVVGAAAVLAGAVLWPRRPTAPAPGAGAGAPAATLVERRVAVAPFEDRTGDTALAALGPLVGDWVAQGLVEAGIAEAVDPQAVRAAWKAAPNPRALGAATGARYVVSGAYAVERDSLRVLARVTDAADGSIARALEPVTVPVDGSREAVAALRERVLGTLGALLDTRVPPGLALRVTPPSLAAYQHWSNGLEYINRNEFRAAIPELTAAVRGDSTFVVPLVYLGIAHAVLGEHAEADSALRAADRARDRLAPGERLLIDVLRAENRGDWDGALRRAREAVRAAGGGAVVPNFTVAWNAVRTNRAREALTALAPFDPERGATRAYAPYWEVLTAAHHELGDYRAELAAAGRGRALHPDHVPTLYAEARAMAAGGQGASAERRLDVLADLPPDPLYSPAEVAWALGRELRAHGQEDAAQAAFARALRWYDARPAAERGAAALRGRRAEALYAAGRWEEARALFERLASERPGEPNRVGDNGLYGVTALGELDYRGHLGALAARRGDRPAALAADRALGAWPGGYLLGRHTYWRARIAALLGERERAVALLGEALQQGRPFVVVHAEADFAGLRDVPAFQALVRPKG